MVSPAETFKPGGTVTTRQTTGQIYLPMSSHLTGLRISHMARILNGTNAGYLQSVKSEESGREYLMYSYQYLQSQQITSAKSS